MKLHCVICSLMATRPGEHSEIGVIDELVIGLPLNATMFESLMPDKGVAPPWQPGTPWDRMFCVRGPHLPWGIDMADEGEAIAFAQQGGPSRLFTDEGWVDIGKDGIVGVDKQTKPEFMLTEAEKRQREIDKVFAGKPEVIKESLSDMRDRLPHLARAGKFQGAKPYFCHVCGEEFEKPWQKAVHARKTGHTKKKK